MDNQELLAIVLAVVCTILAVGFTFPSFTRLARVSATSQKSNGPIRLRDVYQDEDGVATEESEDDYYDVFPKRIFYVAAVAGFATSIASAVLSTVWASRLFPQITLSVVDWLNTFIWVLLLVDAISMSVEKSVVTRFQIGLEAASSSFLLLIVLLVQNGLIANRIETNGTIEMAELLSKVHLGLGAGQFLFGAITLVACLLLPRRPAVFTEDGRAVDNQYTTSAYGRYTFGWVKPLLELSAQKTLDITDLPYPDCSTRSKNIQEAFNPKNREGSLLKLIFFAHWPALLRQVLFTVGQSVFRFSPQLAMLHLLRLLEARSKGEGSMFESWAWVFGLGIGLVIQASLENWMFWISMSELLIPLRSELSALIFQKAMRRKDVKEVEKSDAEGNGNATKGVANSISTKDVAGKGQPEKQAEEAKKAKQSTINLISIDAQRVSGFSGMIRYFPDCFIMFAVSTVFLITLIGWIPLLSGLASFAILFPINYLISVRFRTLQKKLMQARDTKTAIITEALQGMRQIKFSALEAQWEVRIGKARTKELALQWQLYVTRAMLIFGWFAGPVALSSVSLSVYAYLNGSLTPSIAFTTIGVLRSAQQAFTSLPTVTTMLIEASVSLKRIQRYVHGPERVDHLTPGDEISFRNASLSWPSDETRGEADQRPFALRDVNLSFPIGKLSVISGKTGCGKSLLLSSILGESDLINDGSVTVPRPIPIDQRFDSKATADNWILPTSIAYVAQIPWIENATFKDNVTFNLPFDAVRYEKTLEACALTKDLDMLTDGDMTEIGANGINLSGGQRWRITLARALYSRAGILVLDDIFSAVDAHVGRWILDKALTGELGQGRTRILATHHVALVLPNASYAVQLGDGIVAQAGTIDELKKSGAIDEILQSESTEQELTEETIDEPAELEILKVKSGPNKEPSKTKVKKFVEDEYRAKGKIKTAVYVKYFTVSGGLFWWGVGLLVFCTAAAMQLMRSWWVKIWTDNYQEDSVRHMFETSQVAYQTAFIPHHNSTQFATTDNGNLGYYLRIYFALGLMECILGAFREIYVFSLGWRGSRALFQSMLFTVLRTPLRWIDTMPLGRILNRFTADFSSIDSSIAPDLENTIECMMAIFAIMVAAFFASPIIIIFGFILLVIAVYYAKFYLAGAREAKRLESTTKSPIFEQLGSALVGVGTIRAFDNTAVYIRRIYARLDNNITTSWNLFLCTRWLSFRLAMLGAGFTFCVALLIVGIPGIDAATAGFALSFALEFSKNITWALRFLTSCELDMNAAERIIEYCNLQTEPLEGLDAPAAWPSAGRLEVQDLEVGYAEDLPAVLKGLSFTVEAGQRVGIVGRTGAGKSSLAMALFRFLEARSGSIFIDGIDVSKLKLFDLRSRLAIIPQDPTIFSGTVRSNLDAFDQCTDAELKEALQRVHLVSATSSRDETTTTSDTSAIVTDTNTNPFTSLNSPISSGGLNLSQGQRQLLCLARAILSHSKIMILDEATSAVDMDTDALIQRSIREEFQGSTLLVIAHRLSTVADFDRILVMSEGKAVEFGSPRELLEKKGAFWEMVAESGDKVLLENLIRDGGGSST